MRASYLSLTLVDAIGGAAHAQVRTRRRTFDLYAESDLPLRNSANAWFPLLIPIAMRGGFPLHIDTAPARSLVENVQAAQKLLSSWYRFFTPVALPPGGPELDAPRGRGVGAFFSGGVDSFHTALQNADRITHLIYVQGFDIPLAPSPLAEEALRNAQEAAAKLGKQLIVVRTDIRRLATAMRSDWAMHFHGAALAFVAHLLADHLHTVIVPSSVTVEANAPWGSTHELDPLWSSSDVTIEHHGAAHKRVEKVTAITSSEVAMAHLRVCWENRDGAFNCGRCEKCIKTWVHVAIAGGQCATLPAMVDPRDIRRAAATPVPARHFDDILTALPASEVHAPELLAAYRFARRAATVRDLVARPVVSALSSVAVTLNNRLA